MADEKDDQPKRPPLPPPFGAKPPLPGAGGSGLPKPPLPQFGSPKPPLPSSGANILPPGLPPPPGGPARPFLPSLPGLPGMSLPSASAAPAAPAAPTPPAPPPQENIVEKEKRELEKKLGDMEKRLQEEREKLLVANLKSQEEAAASARVEVSIKELQDKLRRERRDQEQEESRLKLEGKLAEMEQRLAQERETWVTTLRNQMQSRETQDKEIEHHFAARMQEMERRSLEEKAQWQKLMLAKDEEIRNLRSLAEKLKGADVELNKAVSERKFLESRVNEMSAERADMLSKVQSANEKDKENIQLRAELGVARQQALGAQERLERELQGLRISAKEREDRLMGDLERLNRELDSMGTRLRAEGEAEVRRVKMETENEVRRKVDQSEAEAKKYKEAAETAAGQLMKLRAVAGALEKQAAAARAQVNDLARTQERYKAEFVVLQRKWIEREKEIRAEAEKQMMQMLEAEKAKIKIFSQEEIGSRLSKLSEQLKTEKDAQVKAAEAQLRLTLQADWETTRRNLEAEIDKLHKEHFGKEAEWSQRVLAKDSELHALRTNNADLAARMAREEESRQALERSRLEAENSLASLREELGGAQALLAGFKSKDTEAQKQLDELKARREELERLATAQAAQVRNVEESLDAMRGQLARETHLTKMYLEEKDQMERYIREQLAQRPPQKPA